MPQAESNHISMQHVSGQLSCEEMGIHLSKRRRPRDVYNDGHRNMIQDAHLEQWMLASAHLHSPTERIPVCSIGDAPRELLRLVHV